MHLVYIIEGIQQLALCVLTFFHNHTSYRAHLNSIQSTIEDVVPRSRVEMNLFLVSKLFNTAERVQISPGERFLSTSKALLHLRVALSRACSLLLHIFDQHRSQLLPQT